MSSIWDIDSLNELDKYIGIHKIGSGDLTNYPLIRKILQTGKPLIISVAMAHMQEISETIGFINSISPKHIKDGKLCILQCVAMYGNPKDEFANLNVIKELKKRFPETIIGYSDHTEGNYAANIAVALGSKILEIHFTDDKDNLIFSKKGKIINDKNKYIFNLNDGFKLSINKDEEIEKLEFENYSLELNNENIIKYDNIDSNTFNIVEDFKNKNYRNISYKIIDSLFILIIIFFFYINNISRNLFNLNNNISFIGISTFILILNQLFKNNGFNITLYLSSISIIFILLFLFIHLIKKKYV